VYSHVIVGGGPAGCVLAARLSEQRDNNVLLIEAGIDTPPDATPDDILDIFPGKAAANPLYLWPGLRATLGATADGAPSPARASYEQARVLGGGSSINGQVATRGAPDDYDAWGQLGARGWRWETVLPFFRRLETDLDFNGPLHGADGPVIIRRLPRSEWDGFTVAATDWLEQQGHAFRPDMNAEFGDGYAPLPLSNSAGRRVSAAAAYLTPSVRARPNLEIRAETRASRILFEGRRSRGVAVLSRSRTSLVESHEVIICAGALHSPALLLRAGVGAGAELKELGLEVVADLPGVGKNLQEHPALTLSAYLLPSARTTPTRRRQNHLYLRYSSGVAGCPSTDMLMNFICQSAWHDVGHRIATIQTYILRSYSRGRVRLASPAPDAPPHVDFALLSDRRDLVRLVDAFGRMSEVLRSPPVAACARDPFPSSYSDRVRRIGTDTPRNRLLIGALARLLDVAGSMRGALIRHVIANGLSLDHLLGDGSALATYIRGAVSGVWHPAGTCRMGAPGDPLAVTDEAGRVRGIAGLRVVDASIMPELPRANTNIPVIMIAEKIADAICRREA
jgi:5-(hydroxymethyl)furfural/furfural oxidase